MLTRSSFRYVSPLCVPIDELPPPRRDGWKLIHGSTAGAGRPAFQVQLIRKLDGALYSGIDAVRVRRCSADFTYRLAQALGAGVMRTLSHDSPDTRARIIVKRLCNPFSTRRIASFKFSRFSAFACRLTFTRPLEREA